MKYQKTFIILIIVGYRYDKIQKEKEIYNDDLKENSIWKVIYQMQKSKAYK